MSRALCSLQVTANQNCGVTLQYLRQRKARCLSFHCLAYRDVLKSSHKIKAGEAMWRFLLALLIILAAMPAAMAQNITDAQIRDVITRVARHQLVPITDGDYAPVNSLQQAQAAQPASGIAW